MEKEQKQTKFPIGSIFLLLSAVLGLFFIMFDNSIQFALERGELLRKLFYVIQIFKCLFVVTLAIVLLTRKKGLPTLVTLCVGVLLYVFSIVLGIFSSSRLYIISNVCLIIALVFLVLRTLKNMNVKKLANLNDKLFKILFLIAIPIYFLTSRYKNLGILESIIEIIFIIGIIWCGLWIFNPFKKLNSVNADDNSYYFISLIKHIFLLIFTFGIWQYIWVYRITKFTNLCNDEEKRNPTTKLLLFMFVPFYSIYWTYKTAIRLDKMSKECNINSELATLCLILAIIFGILPPILMQDKANQIISFNNKK